MAGPNYAARNASLLSRFDRHASHPSAAELRKAAEACLGVAQNFSNERDDVQRDRFLSPDGKRAKLNEALPGVKRRMEEARAPIASAAQGVERLRGALKPVQLDQTAAAAIDRAEIRTWMRGLPSHERMAMLLTQPDPQIIDAVLDKPAVMSGVLVEHYETAKAARDERLHGPALREIEALQAVIDEANAAAGVAANDLASLG